MTEAETRLVQRTPGLMETILFEQICLERVIGGCLLTRGEEVYRILVEAGFKPRREPYMRMIWPIIEKQTDLSHLNIRLVKYLDGHKYYKVKTQWLGACDAINESRLNDDLPLMDSLNMSKWAADRINFTRSFYESYAEFKRLLWDTYDLTGGIL